MAEPSEEAIANVCEFTSLDPIIDRELVVAALKSKANNVEAVVASFFDDEAKFRQSYMWDETSFIGDRDGANDSPSLPTFNVQGPDEAAVIHGVSPSPSRLGAPSRPPSRVQSPLSRVADWAASDAGIVGAPTSKAQEDTELQRALAESAAMSGLHTPQETGIVAATTASDAAFTAAADTNLPFFGPAVREVYDPDQWAMVRAAPEAQEPGPSGRRRAPGTPAFLRCRTTDRNEGCCLNAILTILHSIPAARNALLRTGKPPASYGHNPEWWKGAFIAPLGGDDDPLQDVTPATPDDDLLAPTPPSDVPSSSTRDFIEEVHRVMAFLDSTDRAYGTADNFNETVLIKEYESTVGDADRDLDCTFFHLFRHISSNAAAVYRTLFTEVEMVNARNVDDCVATDNYAILDIKADCLRYQGGLRDLYNAVDAIYWADLATLVGESYELAKMAMISRLASVQIYRLDISNLQSQQNNQDQAQGQQDQTQQESVGLEVPEFFYADRYMAEHRHLALQLQLQLRGLSRLIQESENVRRSLLVYEDTADHIRRDRPTLSEQAINFGLQKLWHVKAAILWKRYEASRQAARSGDTENKELDYSLADVDSVEPETPEEVAAFRAIQAEIAVHRNKLIAIHRKLTKLNAEKFALERLADRLRNFNTGPGTAEGWSPTRRLQLRGVVVSANVFYLCRREAVVRETQDEESSSTAEAEEDFVDQWWRISYNAYDADPVGVVKTTIEAAQDAAFKETDKPTLIYCLEEALTEAPEPLSDALKTFVRFDNRYFKQEILEEQEQGQEQAWVEEQELADLDSSSRDKKRQPTEDRDPTSPPKRQQRQPGLQQYQQEQRSRSGSIDSMATNRASLGDGLSDRDMDEVPLLDDPFRSGDGAEDILGGAAAFARATSSQRIAPSDAIANVDAAFGSGSKYPGTLYGGGFDDGLNRTNTTGDDASSSQQTKDVSLGTEMVQLAISPGEGEASAEHIEDNSYNKAGSGDQSTSETSREDSGNSNLQTHQQEQKEKQKDTDPPAGQIQLLADWDNPEGRYVGPSTDATKEQQR